MAGLAGSLTLGDIPALMAQQPNVLGFRGAACKGGAREGALDLSGVAALRDEIVNTARFVDAEHE
jgi:uncharacterized protein (UPF0264 family)